MGRKKSDLVRKYFSYNETEKNNKCNINNCTTIIAKANLVNMCRHIQNCHQETYKFIK